MSLTGKRVVVTRARDQAEALGALLLQSGAEVVYLPTIEIEDPESWDALDSALEGMASGRYDWLLVTSVNSASRLVARVHESGVPITQAVTARVGAVGGKTKAILESAGIQVDLVPPAFTGEALAKALGSGNGRVLFPRVADGPREIVSELEALGWVVDEVAAYRNALPAPAGEAFNAVAAGAFDAITFLSPSSVTNLVELVGPPHALGVAPESPNPKMVGCIGPRTAERLRSLGFRIDAIPARSSAEDLVSALAVAL